MTDDEATDLLTALREALGATYRIEAELPEGGMSRLFVAREIALQRRVVIKVLPPELASRASAARFQREVAVTATLQHPHVIPVLAAGAIDDVMYYVTPFIEGETLRHRLERMGHLPVSEAAGILREMADALEYAHGRGVIHRDVKPENILLAQGHIYVADFGIVRALDEAADVRRLTRPGSGIGTPGYMAPEQAAGRADLDARADVYALAVVGYEMLTGELPLPGRVVDAVRPRWSRSDPSGLPPDVPPALRRAIVHGLAVDRAERLATAGEFLRALQPEARPTRRWGVIAASVGLAGIAAAAGVPIAGGWGSASRTTSSAAATPAGMDSSAVLFLPFDVLGADPELGRAIPASLRSFADGVRPLRAMFAAPSGSATVRDIDTRAAARLARENHARFAVFGEVQGAGHDSLRVAVSLVDATRSEDVARFEAVESRERASALMTQLDARLVEQLNAFVPLMAVRDGSLRTLTSTGLWWFLRGERYFRTNNEDSAEVAYREALAAGDSTSALGLRRLRTVLRGTRSEWDSTSMAYAVRAGALNHGLGPRDSMLVLADSLYGAIIRAPGDPRRTEWMRRWFGTLEGAVRAYPVDAEVRYELGEAQFHFGHRMGVEPERVLATLETAVQLDPGFSPAYYHAIPLAMRHRPRAVALRLVDGYLRIRPDDEAHRFVAALLAPGGRSAPGAPRLETMSNRDVQRLIFRLRTWPDSDHALRDVFAEIERRVRDGNRPSQNTGALASAPAVNYVAFLTAMLRGRFGEARRRMGATLPDSAPAEFVLLSELGAIPADTASAVFRDWLRAGDVARIAEALHWWAAHGDRREIEAAAAVASRAAHEPHAPMAPYAAAAARAYLALARADTAGALAMLAALPDTLCPESCPPDQIVRARLLLATNRPAAAETVLRTHPPDLSFPSFSEGLWWVMRARAASALGESSLARDRYAVVAALWAEADAPIAELVAEARAGADGRAVPADVARAARW